MLQIQDHQSFESLARISLKANAYYSDPLQKVITYANGFQGTNTQHLKVSPLI